MIIETDILWIEADRISRFLDGIRGIPNACPWNPSGHEPPNLRQGNKWNGPLGDTTASAFQGIPSARRTQRPQVNSETDVLRDIPRGFQFVDKPVHFAKRKNRFGRNLHGVRDPDVNQDPVICDHSVTGNMSKLVATACGSTP